MLDPFCGTGTVLVEARKRGIGSIGIEANPMAHFATRTKTDWSPDPGGLIEHATRVACDARGVLAESGYEDTNILHHNGSHPLRVLPAEAEKLLLSGSISPLPLHNALILRDAINAHDSPYRNHELLALSNVLVQSIGNLHFGPEVGIGLQSQTHQLFIRGSRLCVRWWPT